MPVTDRQCQITLQRLKSFLRGRFPEDAPTPEWHGFELRLDQHFPALFRDLLELYGHHFDFFYHLEQLLEIMAGKWLARSHELKSTDAMREANPSWFQSGRLIGAMAYVDLFAGNLHGLRQKIPYLQELGITYLHLMPVYRTPEGDDDGGFAVTSYREIDSTLGTMKDLEELAAELRQFGISLVLDFVFNHTSHDHQWAQKALEGDETCQDYYLIFDSRQEPDEYEQHIRSIFPDEHPGCFTYLTRSKKWVWTTFHTYQWDLNYRNPEVFNAMAEEMLFLANVGVEVLRLDAVPFIWKQKGTSCENLPEAHRIIESFNAIARVVAPGMVFKSEAIVAPHEVSSYVRSHDDIGWGFDDGDASELGINGAGHRRFLTRFFTGSHEGTYAQGAVFQENPQTGDARVCGTTASLCGLASALEEGLEENIDFALRRILLLHGVIFTIGGIPLIYLGDEIGMLNDWSFRDDAEKDGDERWLHRPLFDWEKAAARSEAGTPEATIYHGLLRLTQMRLNNPALAQGETEIVDPGNDHVLAYFRTSSDQSILCAANFSDHAQMLSGPRLRQLGVSKSLIDIVSGQAMLANRQLDIEPLQFMVLLQQ